MPTGVTVSQKGRIFINFPRWGDKVTFTVAEVVNGRAVPYPNLEINVVNAKKTSESLLSVQSVVVAPQDRLWILDTGSPLFQPTSYCRPKLIGTSTSWLINSIVSQTITMGKICGSPLIVFFGFRLMPSPFF